MALSALKRYRDDLGYRPQVYFWICFFEDGQALPQYDPLSGYENKADPDWLPSAPQDSFVAVKLIPRSQVYKDKRVIKVGWHPFNEDLSRMVLIGAGHATIVSDNPAYYLDYDLEKGETPLVKRENKVRYNVKSGKIKAREIVYVLGKVLPDGSQEIVYRIKEDGSLETM